MGQSYRDLVVWRKAMDLVADIYMITQVFPKEEFLGLQVNSGGRLFQSQAISPKALNGLIASMKK